MTAVRYNSGLSLVDTTALSIQPWREGARGQKWRAATGLALELPLQETLDNSCPAIMPVAQRRALVWADRKGTNGFCSIAERCGGR